MFIIIGKQGNVHDSDYLSTCACALLNMKVPGYLFTAQVAFIATHCALIIEAQAQRAAVDKLVAGRPVSGNCILQRLCWLTCLSIWRPANLALNACMLCAVH